MKNLADEILYPGKEENMKKKLLKLSGMVLASVLMVTTIAGCGAKNEQKLS